MGWGSGRVPLAELLVRRKRCPSCTRRLVERHRVGVWECEVMPCHGPKGTALVHLPAGTRTCPECGELLVTAVATQEALFWLHGFGYGEQVTRDSCRSCGWHREFETAARPTRKSA